MKIKYKNFDLVKTNGKRMIDVQFFATVDKVVSRFLRKDEVESLNIIADVYGSWVDVGTGESIYCDTFKVSERKFLAGSGVSSWSSMINWKPSSDT